ncbi:phosphopantetheine-binding protein [Desulfovibrio sp. SGI.169]|uniref:phosphopantetheine-binding protein n=1 Tax=Desulfovibrio sp. SGI.169 TaxID=3420561 RepID=UPI003CFCD0F9
MEIKELLLEWQDVLQCDVPLEAGTILTDLEEWDSLSQSGMAAFFDRKLGIRLSSDEIARCRTVRDLLALAGKA